jgi:hypothetical protein
MLSQAAAPVELKNRWVHFRISDVHIPDPNRLLQDLYGSHLLQGRVSETSQRAGQRFVVVEVDGIATPLIVSVERILGVL